MKDILKVFAVAAALAVLGVSLMLAGFAFGGPTAARQALNYTSLSQRHYRGWMPGWLERALGWADEADRWAETFEDDIDDWADDFGNDVDRWAEDFEDDVEDWAEGVENWAGGYHGGRQTGWHSLCQAPGECIY